MVADQLNYIWLARRGSIVIDALMRFSDKGLVLGAGTVLAPCGETSRDISIDPSEPRLHALLTAAHLGRPSIPGLAHLGKAADCWREQQDALAAMHLVLSGLDRLEQPEADSHRLFLADGLLKRGADADAIIDAIKSGPSGLEQLRKFDPNQPRVAAGSGRTSGQWTAHGGGASSASSPSGAGVAGNARPRGAKIPSQEPRSPPPPRRPAPTGPLDVQVASRMIRPQPAGLPIRTPTPVSPKFGTPGASAQFAEPRVPPAPSGGGRHALALVPVPATILAGFPFHANACRTARNFCAIHAAESAPPHGPAANDNLPLEEERAIDREVIRRIKTCQDAEVMCDLVDVVVWAAPIRLTGFARFPDGGVVVIRQGDEEGMYFPPGAPIRYRR